MLKLSGMARSTYYYYLKHPNSDKYECEKQEITNIFNANKGRYGYRRVYVAMRNNGYCINHKTIQKMMKQLGLKGKQRKNGQYHSYKGTVGKVADNVLNRDFNSSKPFEKITTDVTQFNVCNEKVYLSPVMDLFNREIVSYSISLSPNLWQIREMLDGLFEKLPADARPIFHSDQGWQYQHAAPTTLLMLAVSQLTMRLTEPLISLKIRTFSRFMSATYAPMMFRASTICAPSFM